MKIIRNTSLQGLSLSFGTPEGLRSIFLAPRKQVEVPNNWNSQVAENLVHRRMLKMTIVPDPQPAPKPVTPPASIKKIRTRNPK